MPTFSAEALQGFKDALSATASGFFVSLRDCLILSFPLPSFFSRWQFPLPVLFFG